jgi:hypothetical protein
MKHSKKSLTLLEVLIAFVFLGLIFTFLMTTFSSTIKASFKLNQIKSEAFSRFDTHRRLFLLFSHLGSLASDESVFYFYTEKKAEDTPLSLHFSVRGILDPEPDFCSLNHCILNIEDNKFLLTYFSDENPSLVRKEVLQEGVSSIDFAFFKQKLWIEQSEQIKKIPPVSSSWKKEYRILPYSLEITLKRQDQSSLILSFPLVSKTYPITYN